MKTDLFLIRKYWTKNKKQLFKLLLSIILLVAIIIVANLCEITECRRKYDDIKHSYNACNIVLEYLSDEEYETISDYPEVDKIARVFTCGRLGSQSISFSYGCYENELAEKLDYLELSYGRLPEKSGETTIYEFALLEMFPNIEIEEMLDKEIELSDYDLDGNNKGKRKLKIVGIIGNGNGNRNLIESCQWWDKALVPVPMPMIFLSRDDLKECPTEYNFALITHDLSEYETEDAKTLYINIIQKSSDAFKKYQIGSDGLSAAASGVMDYQADNKMYEKVYDTDTTLLIRIFSVIAVVISAISLFGVLYSVISERIRSLKLIKTLGYSNLRMTRLLIIEWIILYLTGLLIGIIVGYGLYEIILLLQKNIGHLPALQAINAEWAVRQVTVSPFGIAFICSIITFFLGYVFFIVKAFFFDRKSSKKREKCRSFGKIKRRIFGDKFTNVVQVISFSLIIITATMFYSVFTLNGKGNGNPYLTRPELSGEEYYQYGRINMKNDGFDVCIYSEYSESSTGPIGPSDNGIPKDTLKEIGSVGDIDEVYAYGLNYAGNIVYPYDREDVPELIKKLMIQLDYDNDAMLDIYDAHGIAYYQLPMVSCSDLAVERLSEYVVEGKMGTYENGVILVLPKHNSNAVPYGIGDEIPMIAFDSDDGNQSISNRNSYNVKVEAIALLPDTIVTTDVLSYNFLYNDYFGISLACTPKFNVETYNNNYDFIYVRSADQASVDKITKELRNYLVPSMHLRLKSINECRKDFNKSRVEQYMSVVLILIILFLMMIIGYYSLISLKVHISQKKVSVLRAMGLKKRNAHLLFAWNNLKNTIAACIIGGSVIYILRHIISRKYDEAAELIEKYGYIGMDNNAAITALENRYFIDYEIHSVPVASFFIFISLLMIIISLFSAFIATKNKFNSSISEDLEDRERE